MRSFFDWIIRLLLSWLLGIAKRGPHHQVVAVYDLDLVEQFMNIVVGEGNYTNWRRWFIEDDYETIRIDPVAGTCGYQFSCRAGMRAGHSDTTHSSYAVPAKYREKTLAALSALFESNGYSVTLDDLGNGMVWMETKWSLHPIELVFV